MQLTMRLIALLSRLDRLLLGTPSRPSLPSRPSRPSRTGERTVVLPRLRAARRLQALTQHELAEQARINHLTVFRAERLQPVRLATAGRLARALGVAPAALMDPGVTDTSTKAVNTANTATAATAARPARATHEPVLPGERSARLARAAVARTPARARSMKTRHGAPPEPRGAALPANVVSLHRNALRPDRSLPAIGAVPPSGQLGPQPAVAAGAIPLWPPGMPGTGGDQA